MTEIELFLYELKQYLNLGHEKRIAYGKNFYQTYLKQARDLGQGEVDAIRNMERLVAVISASDGQINRSEYEFCNVALFEKDAEAFMKMCRECMMPAETQACHENAMLHFKTYGHKSCYYIIGLFLIAANGEASKDEQKKFCTLFGIISQ